MSKALGDVDRMPAFETVEDAGRFAREVRDRYRMLDASYREVLGSLEELRRQNQDLGARVLALTLDRDRLALFAAMARAGWHDLGLVAAAEKGQEVALAAVAEEAVVADDDYEGIAAHLAAKLREAAR